MFSILEPLSFTFANPLISELMPKFNLFKSAFSRSKSKSKSTKSSEKSISPLKFNNKLVSFTIIFPSKI